MNTENAKFCPSGRPGGVRGAHHGRRQGCGPKWKVSFHVKKATKKLP